MKFKGLTLDKFQEDAIKSIDNNNSVVVSAATGTGKTLVADYVIDKYLGSGKRIIYTAPIKALSNQKFKDFTNDHGRENVGIMTGDIVINPQAPILIMTTEIYRNMLLSKDESIEEVGYVVFDEIHFISDLERGTVWEESIIFSPDNVRFLCLSATIPNAKEFAAWIQKIKHHKVDVVTYNKRAVPLEHLFFDRQLGVVNMQKLKQTSSLPDYNRRRKDGSKRRGWGGRFNPPPHYELIDDIKEKLPALFFIFNRKECEIKSRELAKYHDFTTKEEKREIIETFQQHIKGEVATMQTSRRLREIIHKGIAFHHAGILPQLKEVVEELFAKGLIKVLYCTETFAVGINMPAKTACFYSLEKYDGINFRFLTRHEYFQLAGRAGRRGLDKVGYAITLYDREYYPIKKLEEMIQGESEEIISQFRLSFNTVLNLVKNHEPEEREKILKMNFDYFLKQHNEKQVRIKASYNNRLKKLKSMNYLSSDDKLTEKGFFACKIYNDELLISEIFNSNIHEELSDKQLLILLAGIEYEEKRKDYFSIKGTDAAYGQLIKTLNKNKYVIKNVNQKNLKRMIAIVSTWYDQGSFQEVMKLTNLMEGDIIRLFRRIIDMLRQVNGASSDRQVQYRMEELMHKIDRGLVEAKL